MEPVKYQFSRRELVIVTTLRFWCQKRIVFAQIIAIAFIIACWFMESPPYTYAICLTIVFISLPIVALRRLNISVKANPNLFVSERTLIADNDGIKVNSAVTSSGLSWSAFEKWSENSKYIFLYLAGFQAVTIPKRAFTSEQLTEFKTLLSKKIRPS